MSLESLIASSGQQATITAEAVDGQVPAQDTLGGADRSDCNWVTVAAGVPCLVSTKSSTLSAFSSNRDDARRNVVTSRIYFLSDPAPGVGLSSRHRITVTAAGPGGPRSLGVYAVQGSVDPNSLGRLIQVDVERVRTP